MPSKVCTKCKIDKPLEAFNAASNAPDGRRPECKECRKTSSKKYYISNSDQIKSKVKTYAEKVKITKDAEKKIQYDLYMSQLNAEKNQKRLHQKRMKALGDKLYQETHREIRREYTKEHYLKNKEVYRLKMAEYREQNKDSLRILKRNYKINRLESDPIYKLKFNLSTLIRNVIKNGGYQKTAKTSEVLGADWDIVKEHIESMFTDDMTWENQGRWHFDHIIPISLAKSEAEVLALNHYSNLRPLWGKENIVKSNKLPSPAEIERYGLGGLFNLIKGNL